MGLLELLKQKDLNRSGSLLSNQGIPDGRMSTKKTFGVTPLGFNTGGGMGTTARTPQPLPPQQKEEQDFSKSFNTRPPMTPAGIQRIIPQQAGMTNPNFTPVATTNPLTGVTANPNFSPVSMPADPFSTLGGGSTIPTAPITAPSVPAQGGLLNSITSGVGNAFSSITGGAGGSGGMAALANPITAAVAAALAVQNYGLNKADKTWAELFTNPTGTMQDTSYELGQKLDDLTGDGAGELLESPVNFVVELSRGNVGESLKEIEDFIKAPFEMIEDWF